MGQGRHGGHIRPVREVVIPYWPRPIWLGFHQSPSRWRVAVAHRRAGKTVAFINEAIKGALTCPLPNPRFGYVAPLLGQAKSVAWDYVKHYCAPIPGAKFNESELRADLPNGGRVRLFGADNYDALRGMYFDGVILDEFGDMDPRAWTEVIRPQLSDRKGWAAFAGTPKGKNEFYKIRNRAKSGEEGWSLWELKASETKVLSGSELTDARNSMDEAAFLREYECSFDAAIEGAYYAKEMQDADADKRLCKIPIDPSIKVNTAWDIGVDDATAIWFFQDIGRQRLFIDYMEVSGEGLPEIAKRLDKKAYRWGRHILPHDADSRSPQTGVTYRSLFEGFGFRDVEIVPRTDDLNAAINQARMMIPKCVFDVDRCGRGIEALKSYRRAFDAKRQTFQERPYHDQYSHGADAFRAAAASHEVIKQEKKLILPAFGAV